MIFSRNLKTDQSMLKFLLCARIYSVTSLYNKNILFASYVYIDDDATGQKLRSFCNVDVTSRALPIRPVIPLP